MGTSEISGAAGIFLNLGIQIKTGKPFETPSLFKNVLLTFLNRLSYVQFVSGAPIFIGHHLRETRCTVPFPSALFSLRHTRTDPLHPHIAPLEGGSACPMLYRIL